MRWAIGTSQSLSRTISPGRRPRLGSRHWVAKVSRLTSGLASCCHSYGRKCIHSARRGPCRRHALVFWSLLVTRRNPVDSPPDGLDIYLDAADGHLRCCRNGLSSIIITARGSRDTPSAHASSGSSCSCRSTRGKFRFRSPINYSISAVRTTACATAAYLWPRPAPAFT